MENDFPLLHRPASVDDVCTMAGNIFRMLAMIGVPIDEEKLRELLVDGAVLALDGNDKVARQMWECMLSSAFPISDGPST